MTHVTGQSRLDQTLLLTDGRTLGYAEYGSPDGPALFVFHGLPGCRLSVAELWNEEPAEIRVVAPDRPGLGLSTFQPGRRFADWARDVRELADELGIERFLVAGFSGGGPHALAVAHGLADRVMAAGCIAGGGPIDTPGALESMGRANRMLFGLVRRASLLVRLMAVPNAYVSRHWPGKLLDSAASVKGLPEGDREAMASARLREINQRAVPETYRQGTRGFVHETVMYTRPWGFELAEITPPVRIWHGADDPYVAVAMARHLAEHIPDAALTVYPGEGHLIAPKHWDEILAGLVSRGDS